MTNRAGVSTSAIFYRVLPFTGNYIKKQIVSCTLPLLIACNNENRINTLVWSAVVSDELFPVLDKLKETGYDGVESLIGAPDEKAYRRFGDYANSVGLETTAVFVLGEDENPVSASGEPL